MQKERDYFPLTDCRQSPRHSSRAFLVKRAEKVSIYKTFGVFFGIIDVSKEKVVHAYDDTKCR